MLFGYLINNVNIWKDWVMRIFILESKKGIIYFGYNYLLGFCFFSWGFVNIL